MKIMAHRGYSGKYPENTMLAFEKAAESGCDGIELDVHETRDGVLVVFHDDTLERTTDGSGRLCDHSYDELRRLNAARRWNGEHPAQRIPAFEEYCAWAAEQPLFTNIEIKTDHIWYPGIERKIWETVLRFGLEKKVLFSSFNHISLKLMQELVPPELTLGALVLAESGLRVRPGEYCSGAGFRAFHPDFRALCDENVKSCKDHGVALNVWTVNDEAELEKLCGWDCEGVITNFPAETAAWLERRGKRNG